MNTEHSLAEYALYLRVSVKTMIRVYRDQDGVPDNAIIREFTRVSIRAMADALNCSPKALSRAMQEKELVITRKEALTISGLNDYQFRKAGMNNASLSFGGTRKKRRKYFYHMLLQSLAAKKLAGNKWVLKAN